MFTAALLAPLEEDKRLLLAVMSQADEFTAEMARAVTGLDGARALLRELTGQNAFITHLPDGRTYRFHHMLKSCAGAMSVSYTHLDVYKRQAENRDKLQIIKERAKQGKFDILLVFMFDRIGRIADETPFVVEWFVKNGIRVWSTQEGEQRFDNHTDKLTNYIRFWQADGESEKTSIRTKTALGQLVEDGGFKGGFAPYGYEDVYKRQI